MNNIVTSEEILINVTPQETRVAVMQLGVVQDLYIERSSSCGIVSNVYLGRVKRVLPGMQSAFIDIGLERSAFLHVADIWGNSGNGDTAKPIEKILFEGQTLLVQVIKEPIGSKGAAQRDALRARLQAALPPEHSGGYIIRTVAETADEPDFLADIAYLDKLWHNLQNTVQSASAPQLLYQELNLSLRVLRDFVGNDMPRIQVDSRVTYQGMLEFAQAYNPLAAERLEHYQGARPLFDLYGVEAEIERALAKRVDLKSGGYLIIDQTEALTTIDVNTGGFVGLRNFDDTIFKTNLEATQVIARQLRLRNLGGIIICDFIDMDTQEHRDAVLDEFKKALLLDHTHVSVSGFSSLGLVEMTRKRTRESLAHVLCEPCPTCQGRGEVKTAQTVCYEILREIVREARQFNAREYRILASQQVIDLFLEEESQALAQLSDFIGKPISMQVETIYSQEQYDVILM